MLWITCLPFVIWQELGWLSVPVSMIVSFLLFGIEVRGCVLRPHPHTSRQFNESFSPHRHVSTKTCALAMTEGLSMCVIMLSRVHIMSAKDCAMRG